MTKKVKKQLRTGRETAATAAIPSPLGVRPVVLDQDQQKKPLVMKARKITAEKPAESAPMDFAGILALVLGLALIVFALYTGYLYL